MAEKKGNWRLSEDTPYFVFDPEGDGFTYFKDEAERDSYAEDCILEYLEEGWSEEVVNVVSGEITHRATQTNLVQRPDDAELDEDGYDEEGKHWPTEWDYICDYEMLPLNKGGDRR